jgi:hypothetical protein
MSGILDVVPGVTIKTAEKKIETISEHLMNMNLQVRDAGHKSHRGEQYELAFYALLKANKGSPALVENFIARRQQFISDAVIGGYPAASHFLEHNKDYHQLIGLPRTQALLQHQKESAHPVQQYVTLVPAPSTGSRNNRRGGGNGGGGSNGGGGINGGGSNGGGYGGNNRQYNAPNQYQQQQQQYSPPMQNQQQGPNNYNNGNSGRGRGPPGTPHSTRSGSQFNGSR